MALFSVNRSTSNDRRSLIYFVFFESWYRPSARLASVWVRTGLPALRAVLKLGQASGST